MAKGMARAKEKELAESQPLVTMQGQEAGAEKGRRQQAEGSKQKGKHGGTRRGRARLPNLELDDLNCRFLIERLSKLELRFVAQLFGFLLSLLLLQIALAIAFDPGLLLLRGFFEFIIVQQAAPQCFKEGARADVIG